MSKGSSNFKSKKSNSSKPYDVSQSFVAKVASRVTELLPQRTWLNRWLSPDVGYHHHVAGPHTLQNTPTPMVNSHHTNVSPDLHGPGPSKRPRLPINSPAQFQHKFLQSSSLHEEELSPIGPPIVLSNDSAVAGPSGLGQFNQKTSFTPGSTAVSGDKTPQLKLENKLTGATGQSSATDKLNGGDDCSETSESTSGCSSLVPQAQTLQSRRSESRHLNFPGNRSGTSGLDRPLFPGRSSPKIDLTSLKRRRPSFDTTTFTSSSRLMNISANPNQTLSPFYSGRTAYGGASAYNSSVSSSTGLFSQTPRRLGVTVRPVNVSTPSEPALSTTAKKILDALEQFSTPVVDAKRLPIMSGSKRKLERYAELNLPTTSELLRVKRKERLQKSTSAARQASLSSSHQDSKSISNSEQAEYRIRVDDGDDEKHINKITRKRKDVEDDQLEKVNLPTAVLPLKTLPKIDIPIPPCPQAANTTTACSSVKSSCATSLSFIPAYKPLTAMSVSSSGLSSFSSSDQEFKMSAPLPVLADTNSRTSLNTENFNFVFSEPIGQDSKKESSVFSFLSSNKSKDSNSSLSFMNAMSDKNKSFGNTVSLGCKKSNVGTNDSKMIKSPIVSTKSTDNNTTTVTTSSMTDSRSKINKPKNNNNWKCNTCSVTNSEENNVCTACDNKKSFAPVTSSSPLVFKPPADTWECKECFIRNKNSVNICAACASPKTVNKTSVSSSSPASSTARSTTIDTITNMSFCISTSSSSVTSTTVTTGFGDKFKPPSDTWECKACLVRNKNTADKCVSCETVKSGVEKKSVGSAGFGDSFKKPEGSWECTTCMIQNDSKSLKCVACETCKPGAKKEASAAASSSITSSGFTFGMPASCSSGTGFTIPGFVGTGSSSKEESKMVSGFQFGGSSSTTNVSANFTFGIPAPEPKVNNADHSPKEKKVKPLSNDKLLNPLQELAKLQEKQSENTQNAFKFGVNHDKSNEKQESNSEKSAVTNRNLFGPPESTKNNDTSKSNVNIFKSKTETTSNSFIFGTNTLSEKTDSANKTSNFIFQPKTDQPAASGTSMLFGNANKTTQPETKPTTQSELFTFGSNASNKMPFSTAAAKSNTNPMFVFGSSGSSSTENKSNIAFGTSNNDSIQKHLTETKPVFGASKEVPPIFGSTKPEVKPIAFGSSLVNDSKSALSNSLAIITNAVTFTTPASPITSSGGTLQSGFKQETPVTDSSFLTFGSNTTALSPFQNLQQTPQSSEKSLFAVNSATPGLQTIPTTQSSGFTFGSGSGTCNNDQAKPFGFGSSQTPSSSFSFGASSTIPAQNFNFTPKEAEPSVGFNFTPAAPVQSNQVPAPVFGVQNPTPSFGSNSTPSNLFTFGSQSAQPQTQPASSAPVFGFNSSQSTPTQNAFVFGSSNADTNQTPVTSTSAVPAFNPNAKPTFNFTGGSTPSFTATPNPLVATPATTQVVRRPIKKAVRRSVQLR